MKRLYDLLGGTRYACDWHAKDMRIIFNNMLEQGSSEEIDLADMGFTVEANKTLLEYGDRICFRNMKDSALDEILKHNREVAIRYKQSAFDRMPTVRSEFKDMQDLGEYVQTVSSEVPLRTLGAGRIQNVYAVCHILAALRPDIKINFGADLANYFAEVRRCWLQYATRHWESYWEVSGSSIVQRKVEDGVVNLSAQEQMGEGQYRVRRLVLPCAFGQDPEIQNCEEFKPLFERAFRILENAMQPAPSLMDYLEVDGNEY